MSRELVGPIRIPRIARALTVTILVSTGPSALARAQIASVESQEKVEKEKDSTAIDEGVAEEILKELRLLRLEVSQLRRALTEVHRATVRPPNPASPPPTPTVSVQLDDDPILGDPEAPFAIVEFSDYQCPYCKRFVDQTFPQIREKYIHTGRVRYVFRDLPLTQIHPQAVPAAIAANCAGQQGRYWDMHDRLFEHQRRLGDELFEELAAQLELDAGAFEACRTESKQLAEVEADTAYAASISARGTPHFFIGRVEGDRLVDAVRISGAEPFSRFDAVLYELLRQ